MKDLIKGKEVGSQNAFPQRKGAPAPSTQAPSQPSNQATQKASPLKAIVTNDTSSPKQVFPERKRAAAPSSQGASASVRYHKSSQQSSSSLKNVVTQNIVSTTNAFPERKEAPAPSSQAPSPAAAQINQQAGPTLKTIVAKDTTPNNAFPERKVAPSPSSQAPPPKQSASGDHAREGLTLRRYTQTRKASTSLGDLANPSAGTQEPPTQVQASVEETTTVKKQVEASVDEAPNAKKPAVKKGSSFANLASLVGNGPVVNRDRSTVNQARSVSTKLGDIAKNPAAHREEAQAVPKKEVLETKELVPKVKSNDADPQEAFQRALLSSRLANGKTTENVKAAKETVPSSSSKGFSSLSAIIQGRDKRSIAPTINRDRSKSSLFPESSE